MILPRTGKTLVTAFAKSASPGRSHCANTGEQVNNNENTNDARRTFFDERSAGAGCAGEGWQGGGWTSWAAGRGSGRPSIDVSLCPVTHREGESYHCGS